MSIPMAFFYPKIGNYEPTHMYHILEKSLSKVLSFYYPYAGRLNKDDGNYVDCNDMGVELSYVHVHSPISQIFRQPYTNAEHVVFPVEQPYGHNEGNLATIQVSHFDCGGIAIGGCLSHKIGDGCTSINFFTNWGILSRDKNATLSPHFVGESIYPQSTDPSVVSTIKSEDPKEYLGKKFIFPADKLNALKAKFAYELQVQNPTRTEVVSSLLYKCAMGAGKVNNSGSFKPSSLFQLANMRQRLNPPLSHNACGNIISGYFVKINNEKDVNCPKLVHKMREGKLNILAEENMLISEVIDSIEKGNTPFHSHSNVMNNYFCTCLTSYPIYKVDFGWGRPIRVSIGTGPPKNWFYLLDNQTGGGVEVIVMLDEQDMAIFESDPELLEFATPITNL